VLLSLSTGNKIGLAAVGATFIAFALVSAFVLPRRNPNFPGRYVGWYVAGCATLFVAMLAAVLIFGVEEKKAEGDRGQAQAAPPPRSNPAGGGGGPFAHGDPAAGKTVFTSAGCSGCHTLKAANATGTTCPNLDQTKPPESRIVARVTMGKAPMPSFKGQLSNKQIADVVAFVYSSTHA
jgi:hypothetical protein